MRWGRSRWFAAIGCALAMASVGLRELHVRELEREVRGQIARVHAAGEPVTGPEMRAQSATVADADNAAVYYAAALALLGDRPVGAVAALRTLRLADDCPIAPPPAEARIRAESILTEQAAAVDLLARAAAAPGCRYEFAFERNDMPLFAPLREAAALAVLRTVTLAYEGDADAAIDALASELRMACLFDTEPNLMTHLMRLVVVSDANDAARSIVELTRPTPEALDRLLGVLARSEEPGVLRRAIAGERAFGMLWHAALLPEVAADLPADLPAFVDAEPPTFWSRPRLLGRARHYLATMAVAVDAASAPWPQALDTVAGLAAHEDIGTLEVAFARTAGVIARTRATRVTILLERQRHLTGALPASLAALDPVTVATIPGDPFSGAPLLYRRDEAGYAVYSVGQNRKDEGGLGDDQSVVVCRPPATDGATVAAWRRPR